MPDSNTPARDPAKDVLAAEAFGVPARDPHLTHGPVVLPGDPTGIEEPHDVLAAEEFAMPAPAPGASSARSLAGRARCRLAGGARARGGGGCGGAAFAARGSAFVAGSALT